MKVKLLGFVLFAFVMVYFSTSSPAGAKQKPVSSDTKEMIELREKFFGAENVNDRTGAVRKDQVILSWVGVSNFAAAINGHVVLLDSWIPRGTYAGYVPATPDELAGLKPEALFIGHSHFDHAADAAEILSKSDAKLVGTAEHCAYIKGQVDKKVSCVNAAAKDAEVGSVSKLSVLKGVDITAVKHVHSGLKANDLDDPSKPLFTLTDLE